MKSSAILLLASAVCAGAQTTLFSDTFDRPDDRNIDASLDGITDATGSSLPADGVYAQPFLDPANDTSGPDNDATNGGGARIAGNQLVLADAFGTSNAYVEHNFTNPEITAAGGFRVSLDLTAVSGDGEGQGGGFAIGMSAADAADTGDAASGTGSSNGENKMTDGIDNAAGSDAVSDFWLVLRADGVLVWGGPGNNAPFGTADVGSKTGTLSATFTLTDFGTGQAVGYEVFHNGASQGNGSFNWDEGDANYIGIDARDGDGVFFNNFEISTLGPVASLEASSLTVAPNNTSKTITLDWTGTNLPAGATYEITADNPVTFPDSDATGPADSGAGSVDAVVDGSLGNTTFTLDLLDDDAVIASDTVTIRRERPNVIVMMTDDMGWSDFGCYGSEIRTPHIDSLASNGLRYRNFYNTARCSTTRVALLSGLYTQQAAADPGASLPNLITENNVTFAELLSLSDYRRYMTGKWHVGTSADRSPIGRGFQHIFGQTSGGPFPHNQVSGGNHDSFWNENNFGFYSENGEIPERDFSGEQFHQTPAIGDYAVDFIDHHIARDDGRPFLLYVPFNAVHWDINAPADMADRYTDVGDDDPGDTDHYLYENGWDQARADRFARQDSLGVRDPGWVLSPKSPAINSNGTASPTPPLVDIPDWDSLGTDRQNDLARRMAVYAAMLEQVDDSVGRIVNHLSSEGLLDNTIIFVLADNGGNYEGGLFGKTRGTINAEPVTDFNELRSMGQPGTPDLHIGGGWANVNNTPFRLYKHYQHEGGIRTPCIVHWPEGITDPGRWVEDRGHLIDIMATISDVTATPHPETFTDPDNGQERDLLPLEGESLAPHFDPATAGDFPERPLGFEHEANRAWFRGNYKFVTKNFAFLDGSSPADELELYDMSTDPSELNNLAAEMPELLSQMVDEWNAWAERVGVVPNRLIVPPPPQVDPAPLPGDLFVDTFNRDNDTDHDASTDGMFGPLVPSPLAAGTTYWDAWEGGDTRVSEDRLLMAFGNGMTETAVRHNFTDQAILDAGGFSVQIRVDEIDSITDDSPNRYAGIAVGLSAAEAQASEDIGSTSGPNYSFRGNASNNVGTADFVVDLDLDGNVKCWSNGHLLDTTPVGQHTGNLLVCCELESFAAGAPVTVSAFLDGEPVDLDNSSSATTRTFQWDAADTNHIGLTARASNAVSIDNFAVRTLPLSGSLASNLALDAGLSGNDTALDADPDGDGDDNFTEWLKNGDPAASDAGVKLLSLAASPDGGFRFNQVRLTEPDKAGVTYTYRYSTDLEGDPKTWPTFTPQDISAQNTSPTHEAVLSEVPAGLTDGNGRLFILLQAE